MNWFLKLFSDQRGFIDVGSGEGDNPPQDPPANDPPADPPALPVVDPIKAAVEAAIKPLVEKIGILEQSRNNPPPADLPPVVNEIDAEIKLREDQLAAIEAGTIDKKYQPAIMSKLSEAQARKVGNEMVGQQNEKSDFNNKWNSYLKQAYDEFPELKDTNSELHKEAKAIVESDPSYLKYVQSFKPGAKIDFSGIDP